MTRKDEEEIWDERIKTLQINYTIPPVPNSMAERVVKGIKDRSISAERLNAVIYEMGAVDLTPDPTDKHPIDRLVVFPDESAFALDRRYMPQVKIFGTAPGYQFGDFLPPEFKNNA